MSINYILEQTSYLHHSFSVLLHCPSFLFTSEFWRFVGTSRQYQPVDYCKLYFSSWLVWFIRDWYCKENPVAGHLAISVTLVQLYKCHMLSNHYFEKCTYSFDHWSPLLSICTSLEVIIFTAFSVGASGNKSMAWLSSKVCVRLGSGGIEPTIYKKGNKLFFQDLKAGYRQKTPWLNWLISMSYWVHHISENFLQFAILM